MPLAYALCVTIHIVAATLWVGGMGFFALVVVPVARRQLEDPARRTVLRAVGARFTAVGWWVLGTLLVTGVGNLWLRGLLPSLALASFWKSSFGATLAAKLALVALVFVASLVHARDARRNVAPSARARSSMLGRLVLVLSVVVVALAVFLVRGGVPI